VQSDVRTLLLYGGLNLGERDLEEVTLEAPAGGGKRIDIETGFTVIETKRDLRSGNVRAEAEQQLAGYVMSRAAALGQRYVGILTDGAEWRLYHSVGPSELREVARYDLSPPSPNIEGLVVWLEGALATVEAIRPSPKEIERRLGARSTSHALDYAGLMGLYAANTDNPTVRLKRELWARLLRTAFGTSFEDDARLFVNHTLLVVTAEVIAHAVVGLDPANLAPASIVAGQRFAQAGITGVVEEDFFDWVVEVPGGEQFVRTLARRLTRFAWGAVEHDVMKVLYESVIDADERHRLGEYYTPDWLAEKMVTDIVDDPLGQRVLDPACGSGTFVFHAVRHHLAAADAAGMSSKDAILGATQAVLGVDVHPLAVSFARVTYLLAIGLDRLQAPGRPNFHVPIYLGDSLQWRQEANLLTAGHLSIPTDDGVQLFASELRFPDRLLDDAGRFDQLVGELADKAGSRTTPSVPSLASTFARYAVHPDDQKTVEETFAIMCRLHDEGRDHVWGYYVRNLARPSWLARDENRVDRLVGNPPWLAYRFMTPEMQRTFRMLSEERGLWAGAAVATHQDLSGLFAVRAIEMYLRPGGRFAFVLPFAALSRRQFAGFRKATYGSPSGETAVSFETPWDLHSVKPNLFRVPPAVVFGARSTKPVAVPTDVELWSGRLPTRDVTWDVAAPLLSRTTGDIAEARDAPNSPYHSRFLQGATFVPRFLHIVEPSPASPIGVAHGRRAVRSARSANEKAPWKSMPLLEGAIEEEFLRPLHLGSTVLPFRLLPPWEVIVPWSGGELLDTSDAKIERFRGLAEWSAAAEKIWDAKKRSTNLSLLQRIDYRHGLSGQFPIPPHRVVYGASGQYLTAARLSDPRAVVESKLYWAAAASTDEALYLTSILNAPSVTRRLNPIQSRGEHNPRDFHKVVWRLPIPIFDPQSELHQRLVDLASKAEQVVAAVDLSGINRFEIRRRVLREALEAGGLSAELDKAVESLLTHA
jgi:SAM-dependent methyltransferase